ncbi:MAG: glycosyltransferase family 4 protein [Planctomycetia bacterium]|nr:glycosyltransferase family 4 protein [Planctomycetia bacterium]
MSAPRVLLISRRFWPLVGGAESMVAALATELRRQQAQPSIVTARWQPDWPAEIVHRGVHVTRLPNPALRGWGTLRYMLSLGRWMLSHAGQFDVAYVSMLKHDAYAALAARQRGGWPVVLRAEGGGATGDCAWQREANFGRRIARQCHGADAIVAPSIAIRDELLAAGYPPQRVHLIPNGVEIPPEPDDPAAARRLARTILAEANDDLVLPPGARLAVYAGRLHAAKGLTELVTAWQTVAQRDRNAWLWLFGEGPLEDALAEQIRTAGLGGRVRLAGVFDEVGDVLRAADLFVLPSHEEGLSLSLLEAMASGVPVVATDIPGNRQLVEDGTHGLLVPVQDATSLAAGIDRVLSDPAAATRAAAGRERVRKHFSLDKMAREHVALFERLIAERGR